MWSEAFDPVVLPELRAAMWHIPLFWNSSYKTHKNKMNLSQLEAIYLKLKYTLW